MYKFTKLDIFMVKPYLKKYLLILLAISIPIIISTKNVYMMAFMSIFYGVMMVSYPFALSEKNNINNFYGTLSVNKRSIVKGRYIFSLFIMIMFTAIGLAAMLLGSVILKINVDFYEIIFILSTGMFIGILLLSIQIPVFFKLGYTKGKLFTYLPFIALAIAVPLMSSISKSGITTLKKISVYVENNTITSSVIIVLVALLIFEISNVISQKLYMNK